MKSEQPIKILHVVGGMDRGGAETWLMHVLRHLDRGQFQMDFLVHTDKPCAYDDEIRERGSKVIPCLHFHRPLAYARNFRRIMAEHGPYDVIHSAVHHFSGYTLLLAKQSGIPMRVAHSHNSRSKAVGRLDITRPLYLHLMCNWIRRYATHGLACSMPAAVGLFGEGWVADPRWKLHYCSVNLEPFHAGRGTRKLRAQFGIPSDAFVVGHVGRFDLQKNHVYLVKIARELVKRNPGIRILLVGEGQLRTEIQGAVMAAGLHDHVIFTGLRSDVPELMLQVMDCFILPSLYEGLPLVAVEAQSAGLPTIIADTITPEAIVVKPLARQLPLSLPPAAWADQIIEHSAQNCISPEDALRTVVASPFNMDNALRNLEQLYLSARYQARPHSEFAGVT